VTLYCKYIGDSTTEEILCVSSEEAFSDQDVEGAFIYLINQLQKTWSKTNFESLQDVCLRDSRLPNTVKNEIENVSTLRKVFNILTPSRYCTWIDIRILKRMAKVAELSEAKQLIKAFEQAIYSRKYSEVASYFTVQQTCIDPDHFVLVIAKINKYDGNIIVNDLIRFCEDLERITKTPNGSCNLTEIKQGCLEITVTIPMYCYLHAYNMTKSNYFLLRNFHFQFVKIGTYPKVFAISMPDIISLEKKLDIRCECLNIACTNGIMDHNSGS